MRIYHNEIDKQCCEVLRRHFPESVVDDRSIEDVQPEEIKEYDQCHFFAGIGGFSLAFERECPDVPVWTGGFPCQDLSVAGNRKGLAGERSGLYFAFHKLIVGNLPGWVVLENVPGLLSSNEGRDFAIVVGGLTGVVPEVPETGWGNAGFFRGAVYQVAYRVLDAQFFGVPQRRRRVFVVASLGSGRCAEVLFERESMSGDFEPGKKAGKRVARSIAFGSTTNHYDESQKDYLVDTLTGSGDAHSGFRDNKGLVLGGIPDVVGSLDSGGSGGKNAHGGAWPGTTLQSMRAGHSFPVQFANTFQTGSNGNPAKESATLDTLASFAILAHGQPNAEVVIDGSPSLTKNHEAPILFDVRNSKELGETSQTIQGNGGKSLNATPVLVPPLRSEGGVTSSPTMNKNNTDSDFLIVEQNNASSTPDMISLRSNPAQPAIWEMSHADEVVRDGSEVAPTLQQRMGTGGNQVPMIGVRRLTPTECARLQGFPDDWNNWLSDSARYRQFGNAVAAPVVEWIAKRIRMANEM